MRIPDFFVVGAPKCGTTALYTYLKGHPSILMAEAKEINFFSEDFPEFRDRPKSLAEYKSLFSGSKDTLLCGDASATYLYSKVAIPKILTANPDAKFIAMLRNPANAVRSLHQQLLYNFQEDVPDLGEAWRLQAYRRQGQCIPKHCHEPKLLLYREVYDYPAQITRFFRHVAEQNRLVLIFEEFIEEPLKHFNTVLEFLAVDQVDCDNFRRVNERKTHRLRTLHELFRYPPFPLNYVRPQAKRLANRLGWKPLRALERINSKPLVGGAAEPEIRGELDASFSEGITQLEQMLGRSLEIWRQV